MKALVYHGPGKKSLEERPTPKLAAPSRAAETHALKVIIEVSWPARHATHA